MVKQPMLKRAALIGAIITIPISVFAFSCGSIHSSHCGFLTLPAYMLFLPIAPLASIFPEYSPAVFIILFVAVTFVWVSLLTLACLWLRAPFPRLSSRNDKSNNA